MAALEAPATLVPRHGGRCAHAAGARLGVAASVMAHQAPCIEVPRNSSRKRITDRGRLLTLLLAVCNARGSQSSKSPGAPLNSTTRIGMPAEMVPAKRAFVLLLP